MDTYVWLRGTRDASKTVLPFGSRGVLAIMADAFMDEDGHCWPSLPTLAAACGLSREQLSRHLKVAIDGGYLLRDGGNQSGRPTHYDAALPTVVVSDAGHAGPGSPSTRVVDDPGTTEEEPVTRVAGAHDPGHGRPTTNPGPTQTDNPAVEEEAVDVTTDERAREAEPPPAPAAPVSAPLPETSTAKPWSSPVAGGKCSRCGSIIGTERVCAGWETCGPCSMVGVVFPTADRTAVR